MNITGLRKVLELSQEDPVEQRRPTSDAENKEEIDESVKSVSQIARAKIQKPSDKQRNWRHEPAHHFSAQTPSWVKQPKPFPRPSNSTKQVILC